MTAAKPAVPGIFGKILHIQQNLTIEKTGYDERQDYHYFRAEDVAVGVRRAMSEQKIIHYTEILETREDNKWDQNGRNRPRVSFTARVHFVDTEDGSSVSTDVVATGSDTGGDKGTRKAQVQAFKIAAVDLFIITEEHDKFDSDGDKESEPINMDEAPQEVRATVQELVAEVAAITKDESNPITGKDVGEIGAKIAKELGFGIKSTIWKKESAVMERVVAELKALVKLNATGEVD
ncbi:hypothetical protein SEA_FORK_71 [Microbacterium phage Fork]|nr:hypothetical protein SEA_LYELL_75 [Microbacterium phage Lyell]AXC36297.1 hypothetical protein SEA_FORK_71 [Microbacterium phage Fork]QWS69439.1 hypothetical protein SEA_NECROPHOXINUS_77 [Microbacterium phage Necrophoxinus]WMI33946.1 hypothetical protein SEA_ERENYEAGER_76 [Microbacterium phage Erenyeager]